MPFPSALPLQLRPGDRDNLESMVRKRTLAQRLVFHARIVLCCADGLPHRQIKRRLNTSVDTVLRWRKRYEQQGIDGLLDCPRPGRPPAFSPTKARDSVFEILHSPPISHDINRTSWTLKDLRRVILKENGISVSYHLLRSIIRSGGYTWKKAKKVLTSNDPEYGEKLYKIKSILSSLGKNDRFFSIDEFGPFAIKMIGGRRLVGLGEHYCVPQFQESKGCLVITAALELSTNQVTHFYSKEKNTGEMIRLLGTLLTQYKGCKKLYLSWDAGSWHASRALYERVEEVNGKTYRRKHHTPRVGLAPLPASAQFLNVIESVFSGMARAVIHNSNYASVHDAKKAIDRHFRERNAFFRKHPKRAGNKIWRKELVPSKFSESQNCKDPKWQRH